MPRCRKLEVKILRLKPELWKVYFKNLNIVSPIKFATLVQKHTTVFKNCLPSIRFAKTP